MDEGNILYGLKDAKTTGRLVFFATDGPEVDDVTLVKPEDLPDFVKESDMLVRMIGGEMVECSLDHDGTEVDIWIGALVLDRTAQTPEVANGVNNHD